MNDPDHLRSRSKDSEDSISEDDKQQNGSHHQSSSSRSSRQRRTVLIAATFLLGYSVLLIAVYHRFSQSSGSLSSASSNIRDICVTEDVARKGGGGVNMVMVREALSTSKTKLVQAIREATNPFYLYSTTTAAESSRIRITDESSNNQKYDSDETHQHLQHEQSTALRQQQQRQSKETKEARHQRREAANIEATFLLAHTTSPNLDDETLASLHEFKDRVLARLPDLHERAAHVHWGGYASVPWWMPAVPGAPEAVDRFEGGRLLWYYFKILRRYISDPGNLSHKIHFPFRLCKKHGCAAEDAIAHSLEWREKYQPWRITPGMVHENRNGYCYARGFSPSAVDDAHGNNYGRHAVVWFRLGRHTVQDSYSYFRVVLHTLDRAVAEALHESSYRVGKFNVLIDGTDFDFHKVPSLSDFKHLVTITQDHFENRVGVLVLVNVSRTAEFIVNLVKPLITKEVRDKIIFLSHDPVRRAAQLEAVLEHEYIPDWLGGPDMFQFDANEYYSNSEHYWSDEEGRAFVETMPYHAL